MGHSGDDAVHKIHHKMKTHWQNQLKILVLFSFKILYTIMFIKKYMLYLSNGPLKEICDMIKQKMSELILWHTACLPTLECKVLRGNCTPNQNWTCFVSYLKISTCLNNNRVILKQFVWETTLNFDRPSCSWVIDQNVQINILISNSYNTWPTKF